MGVGDTGPKIRGFVRSVMVGRTARAQRSPLIIGLKKLQCRDTKHLFWARILSEFELSRQVVIKNFRQMIILYPTFLRCKYLIP